MIIFALLAISICSTSAILSVIKKRCKCTRRFLLMIVSILISVAFGVALSFAESFGMGRWSILFYSLCIFGLQYVVSQEVLDSIVKKLVDKVG